MRDDLETHMATGQTLYQPLNGTELQEGLDLLEYTHGNGKHESIQEVLVIQMAIKGGYLKKVIKAFTSSRTYDAHGCNRLPESATNMRSYLYRVTIKVFPSQTYEAHVTNRLHQSEKRLSRQQNILALDTLENSLQLMNT